MKLAIKRVTCAALASVFVLSSCAAPNYPGYQAAERGMQTFGTGLGNLILAPFMIVADYTHTRSRGVLLVAVVYRHTGNEPFQVCSKNTGIVTMFRPANLGWRSAYERDIQGQLIDEVIDWTAIEYASLQQDKLVATLMAIGAESIKSGKRSHEYWAAEKRWIAGETTQVMAESSGKVQQALALK